MVHENLIGAWKLLSHQFVATGTGESRDMFGIDPQGSLLISANMRMVVLVTKSERQTTDDESALFNSVLAYAGQLRIEGKDQFITSIDVSWRPDWVGTEQTRQFSLDGDILTIMTQEMLHPIFSNQKARGILKFARA